MQHLTDRIVAFRDARDWSQYHGLKDEALSLLIEAGEVVEHLRWHDDDTLRVRRAIPGHLWTNWQMSSTGRS